MNFPYTTENRMDVSAGGLLAGPGGERDDLIPAIAPVGTTILNASAVRLIGVERLDLLSSLVGTKMVKGRFSPGEYVLRPAVSSVVGRKLLQAINDLGNDVYRGEIAADSRSVEMAVALVDDAIAQLTSAGIRLDDPAIIRADAAEDGVRLAGGGLMGIMLGAGADEVGRQQVQDRLNRAQDRADELLQLEKPYYANVVAQQGIKLKQGQQQQADDDAVRQHLAVWMAGKQKIQNGDYSDLTAGIDSYNRQEPPFDDGHTLVPQSTPDGPMLNHTGPDGTVLRSIPMRQSDAIRMFDQGMVEKLKFMSPARYDQAAKLAASMAEKASDRESRATIAGTQADARMYGADARADATALAADTRASATTDAARIRATAPRQGGGLTAAQERSNAEIDAARQAVGELDPAEIRRRSQKATNTGRENPDFDQSISRAANLAGRRKIGVDDVFDGRQQKSSAPAFDRADIGKRFRADKSMQSYTLGNDTPNGVEVMDKGRVIGHFR